MVGGCRVVAALMAKGAGVEMNWLRAITTECRIRDISLTLQEELKELRARPRLLRRDGQDVYILPKS